MERFTILFVAIIVTAAFSYAQNSGKVVLAKGQKLNVENQVRTVTNMELLGNSMELLNDVTSANLIEIKNQKDKTYDLSTTLIRLKITSKKMGEEESYNSENESDRGGEMGKQLDNLLNKPHDIALGENGKVISGAVEKIDGAAIDPAKAALTVMSGGAGDSRGVVEAAFLIIPAGTKVGYSWTDSSVREKGIYNITYAIREFKGSNAILDIKGTVKSTSKMNGMGSQVTINMTGTFTGELIVEMVTGVITSYSTNSSSSGIMDTMNMQIPLTTKISTKTTVAISK